MQINSLLRSGLLFVIFSPALFAAETLPTFDPLVSASTLSSPGFIALDPIDRSIRQVQGPACPEAHTMTPGCGNAMETCLDGPPLFGCIRSGFLFRISMCVAPGSQHEEHEFDWTVFGPLPPAMALRTPPGDDTDAQGTSTAYIGGDIDVPPNPPSNGMNFGLLTGDYCDFFDVDLEDTCPITEDHLECNATFSVEMRVLGVPDEDFPIPFINEPSMILPGGSVGFPYFYDMAAFGGIQNYVWAVVAGEFPPGLELDPATGEITGSPTEKGIFEFDVRLDENPTDPIFVNGPNCSLAPQCPPLFEIQEFVIIINDPDQQFKDGFENPVQVELVINEIMQNPAAVADTDGEWFELYNAGADTLNIDGWTIMDASASTHVINNGGPLLISAGEYLVLGINGELATNGGVPIDYVYDTITLGNGSDSLILQDTAMAEIDRVDYDDGATFPDPNGAAMALIDPALDNNVGANWCEASTPYGDGDLGTPGGLNDC